MPDREDTSLIIQLIALLVALCMGLFHESRPKITTLGLIGITTNVIAQVLIAGGGPGACAGMVVLPLYVIAAGYLGWFIRLGCLRLSASNQRR